MDTGARTWSETLPRFRALKLKRRADKRAERRALVKKRYPFINVTEEPEEIPSDPAINAIVIATPVLPRAETE
jgi:predicted dehydrogenase